MQFYTEVACFRVCFAHVHTFEIISQILFQWKFILMEHHWELTELDSFFVEVTSSNLYVFFYFVFWHNFRIAQKIYKWFKEYLYILHPDSSNVNVLYHLLNHCLYLSLYIYLFFSKPFKNNFQILFPFTLKYFSGHIPKAMTLSLTKPWSRYKNKEILALVLLYY